MKWLVGATVVSALAAGAFWFFYFQNAQYRLDTALQSRATLAEQAREKRRALTDPELKQRAKKLEELIAKAELELPDEPDVHLYESRVRTHAKRYSVSEPKFEELESKGKSTQLRFTTTADVESLKKFFTHLDDEPRVVHFDSIELRGTSRRMTATTTVTLYHFYDVDLTRSEAPR